MKEFGTPDADLTAYKVLIAYVADQSVNYILHHQRMPVDARPCKLPLSLRVQAVLANGQVVTAFQAAPGKKVQIQV